MENKNIARTQATQKVLSSLAEQLPLAPKSRPARLIRAQAEKKLIQLAKGDKRFESIEKQFLYKEELRKLLFSINDINEIPSAILKLTPFHSFDICHFLVHEKGKPIAQNFQSSSHSPLLTNLISVQDFNQLFNVVKKSKNKVFNQSQLAITYLDTVGTFLAKEIDLKNYSVICVISKNSFLSPEQFEIEQFNDLSLFLSPLFIKALDKHKNNFLMEVLKKSLALFPEQLSISKDDEIVFTNFSPTQDLDQGPTLIIESSDNFKIAISNTSQEHISAELYHSQRVALLGELLNTLQHELSNPLFGLSLASNLLKSETNNLETIELLGEISQYAIRSQTIIKNFSNLYNGQQEFKPINLANFLEEVTTLTKSETKQIRKILNWKLKNSTDKSDLVITTNPTWLSQIIFNLIINAAQALKAHYPDLRQSFININIIEDDDHLKLEIEDNGPGVQEDISQEIFHPFFTTKDTGTGLGLAICQSLAVKLGTNIVLKNNYPLLGATFSINLPL